jgi:hypothetical protein
MAMTLADAANLEKDPMLKGIYEGLMETTFLMEKIPFATIGELQRKIDRWKDLPGVGWRRVNEGYTESTGTTEQIMESLSIMGGEFDIDTIILEQKNLITDPRALQLKMKLRAMAYEFNDVLINGDQAVNPKAFDGLKVRVAGLPATQTIDTACDITRANRTANAHLFLDLLDEAFSNIEGGKPDIMLMNKSVKLAFKSILRRADLLDHTKDRYDRKIDAYDGVPFIDLGYKADQSSWVIDDDFDGVTNNTSIFLLKFGAEEYMSGLQMHDIRTKDIGDLEGKPAKRMRLEWPVGLAIWDPRSVVRFKHLIVD